jgi:hypothetical protein
MLVASASVVGFNCSTPAANSWRNAAIAASRVGSRRHRFSLLSCSRWRTTRGHFSAHTREICFATNRLSASLPRAK